MNNSLQVFKNEEFGEIRTIEINGEPWFVGKDIAVVLGYSNPKDAICNHVDEEDRYCGDEVAVRDSMGRDQHPIVINESGMYSLILSSRIQTAKKFKKWVTSEVLPSIRKHGGYIANQEEMTDEELLAKSHLVALNIIKKREERIAQLESKNKELESEREILLPKADYFDALVDSKLLTNFRVAAHELKLKPQTFTRLLIDMKYIYRDSRKHIQPYAKYVKEGLFEIKDVKSPHSKWSGSQTFLTPRGKEYFRLKFESYENMEDGEDDE